MRVHHRLFMMTTRTKPTAPRDWQCQKCGGQTFRVVVQRTSDTQRRIRVFEVDAADEETAFSVAGGRVWVWDLEDDDRWSSLVLSVEAANP